MASVANWVIKAPFCLLLALGFVSGQRQRAFVYDHLYNMISSVDFALTVPQQDEGTAFSLHLGLALHRVVSLDSEKQELVVDGVLNMNWSDPRLQWRPYVYTDVEHLVWPSTTTFWTPDIVIVNGVGSKFDTSPEASSMSIDNNAQIRWSRRVRMRVPCNFDEIKSNGGFHCDISLSSWSHDSQKLRLHRAANEVDLSQYWRHSKYEVMNFSSRKSSRNSFSCPGPIDVITFTINVKG